MPLLEQALGEDLEGAVEQRFGKLLTPGAGLAQGLGQAELEFGGGQAAIGLQTTAEILGLQMAAHLGVEGGGKGLVMRLGQAEAGGHGVTAELGDEPRMSSRHGVQGIADVQPGHRARRALEHAVATAVVGEGQRRAVILLLEP